MPQQEDTSLKAMGTNPGASIRFYFHGNEVVRSFCYVIKEIEIALMYLWQVNSKFEYQHFKSAYTLLHQSCP